MATLGRNVTITLIGHGTFHLTTPEGRNILIDAWVDGNPVCPEPWKARVRENLAAIFVTHGHFDHIADLVDLARETGATVVCQYDMVPYLEGEGIPAAQLVGFNKGGTVTVADVRATMTTAHHSSTITRMARSSIWERLPVMYCALATALRSTTLAIPVSRWICRSSVSCIAPIW